MTDPAALSLAELSAAYATGSVDPSEATEAYLAAIQTRNDALNAYIDVHAEAAREAAAAASKRRRRGVALGPLDGAPIALKDNIDMAGLPTANGCAHGPIAASDATVVRRLKAAGAVILGKLNQHELAFGASTDNPHWGETHNPAREGWTPGGSSGGSGAVVAAGLAAATLGTDTMGSVRIPAAYCGVFGLKPSFGAVSTAGVSPLAWRLDHVGPLARAPADLALMLSAMTGIDLASADSRNVAFDRREISLSGLRVGRLEAIDAYDMDADVAGAYDAAMTLLAQSGAEIVSLDWPGFDFGRIRRAGLLVCEAEAAVAYAADIKNDRRRFSDDVLALLDFGKAMPATKLVEAERRLAEARRLMDRAFVDVDVILAPAAPMPPFAFSAGAPVNQADFTALANAAGCPAVAFPAGETAAGLPLALQFMGPRGADFRLIALAEAFAELQR